MRRYPILIAALFVCLAVAAQSKLTPKAMLHIAKEQARTEQAARAKGSEATPSEERTVKLVVKMVPAQAAEVFTRLRQAGAEVLGRLGSQAVVSVPLSAVPAVEAIEGVVRIDTGHKPQFKSDVTRSVTEVSQLNGPGTIATPQPYTGKGVTVCLFDSGFDFQHPAFKDSEGNSRIKCVYMVGGSGGHPFTVNDPEAGEITFPGSVFDTPELIATLTTDNAEDMHGTHTAGIAAGSLSPMGFGGMAPEADLVLIAIPTDSELDDNSDGLEIVELIMAFASAYADQCGQPMVFSCSANYHFGPHDGTGTVPEAIEELSAHCIPVFSAGNEGGNPVHLYRKFQTNTPSVKALLLPYDETDDGWVYASEVFGITRAGTELTVQLSVYNLLTGKTVWTSEKLTATPSCEEKILLISGSEDNILQKYYLGDVALAVSSRGKEQMIFEAQFDGNTASKGYNFFQISISGAEGTEFDAWESMAGFYTSKGSELGDSEMSGGDWTSTPGVISVGAWCANTDYRSYDGSPEESSDYSYTNGNYAWFSSYGTMLNGVQQPVVSAPGVNIVSSWNHYYLADDETVLDNMQWQGFPYGAESGTSMSCPAVSGIVALWLQACPDLTVADVKKVLRETSLNDSFTLNAPIRFGYGKINAARGIAFLTDMNGIKEVGSSGTTAAAPYFDLQGRPVDGRQVKKGIYITGNRKVVVNSHR